MYYKILVGCLFVLFVNSCKKDRQTDIIVNIDDDFYINMFEDISNGERWFQLNISTISEQTCLNYQIEYDISIDKQTNNIELIITDLLEPLDCVEGTDFANATIPFGHLVNGTYGFSINLKDAVINTGQMIVFEDQYFLEMDSDDGIEILNDRLYRIPSNTIWGYVSYTNSATQTNAEDFINNLENLSSVQSIQDNPSFNTGYYGYFDLSDLNAISLNQEIQSNFIPFIFTHDNSNLEAITSTIENACMEFGIIEIRAFTEFGLELMCE